MIVPRFNLCDTSRARIVASMVALFLAACASQVARPPSSEEQPPPGFPDTFYAQLAQRGGTVFRIEPDRSLVVIEVLRAGSLANLGHDHVVASHDVRGYIAPNDARADFYIRLDRLAVDEPELRTQAGFATQPPEAAIAGTRENMLGKFNAEQNPYAVISVGGVGAGVTGSDVNASITLNGVTKTMRIPVNIKKTTDQLTATGRVALTQTAFRIVPYSILAGALQVRDEVDVRFVIHAGSISP
jgi:hypothetical protein